MNKEEIIKEKLRVNFNPRRFGKLQPLLLEFYGWCKKKKSAIFAMPEGNIYSQKAHDNILKAQREDLLKKIEGQDKLLDKYAKVIEMVYDGENIKKAEEIVGLR